MSSNIPVAEATMQEAVLPERVQEALGQLVGAAKEGLLALSVGVGLGVLTELMEEEVDDVVGPRGKHNAERTAVRHGHEGGEVTLGGRRVEVARPRVRTADGESEVELAIYQHFADRDPLARVVLERMLAGVSTRRYRRTQEPVGEQVEVRARSTSKSAVSRTFVERTREALDELMARQLADLRLAVMMLDGLELKGRMMIVALGITTEGVKIPLGLWEGSTENATVATALLSDLVERGLDPEQGMLFVLDGSKALRKAVRSVFGEVPVQRCLWHKERNVLGHLPERDRPPIKARMRRAWRETDYPRALEQLTRLADELDHTHPGAAGSLREGMPEIRRLRDLTRLRKAQTNERGRTIQRLEKVLQDAGIKLSSVASTTYSKSARAILEALLSGVTDPEQLAELSKGKMRPKIPQLREALQSRFQIEHHGIMIAQLLAHIDTLDAALQNLSERITFVLTPHADIIELLCTVPGVQEHAAQVLSAECGLDMTLFPTVGHFASWAGACPGHHQSASRRGSGRTRPGPRWLTDQLTECARAAVRTKETYLAAHYAQLRGRRGEAKAIGAIRHDLLVAYFHIVRDHVPYRDLGPDWQRKRYSVEHRARRLQRQLEALGYAVTLDQVDQPPAEQAA